VVFGKKRFRKIRARPSLKTIGLGAGLAGGAAGVMTVFSKSPKSLYWFRRSTYLEVLPPPQTEFHFPSIDASWNLMPTLSMFHKLLTRDKGPYRHKRKKERTRPLFFAHTLNTDSTSVSDMRM
jgi:hypothetical protein